MLYTELSEDEGDISDVLAHTADSDGDEEEPAETNQERFQREAQRLQGELQALSPAHVFFTHASISS